MKEHIRTILDFPIKGIKYRDITTLLKDPDLFSELIDKMTEPWSDKNIDIQCGGVLVRPGDVVVGDNDGVVVVPSWFAEECIEWVEDHEGAEAFIKEKILKENAIPGKYYPPTSDTINEYRKSVGKEPTDH